MSRAAGGGRAFSFQLAHKGVSMKSSFCLAVAAVVVLGMSSAAMARGGGAAPRGNVGGGQRSAGDLDRGRAEGSGERQISNQGARENKLKNDNAQTHSVQNNRLQNNNVENKSQQLQSNYSNSARPFSPTWYANHPGAWQYTHPHADAWAVASLAGAAGWLGIPAYGTDDDSDAADDTVTTADTGDDQADDSENDDDQASTSDLAAATQLAASGANAASGSADFLPLGVFALAPQNQKEAAALLQIAVSKDGMIRGSYYDLLTDQGHTIQGAIDKKTQRVAFTIGNQGKTVFETQLVDLTDARGEISLHFANGEATDWTLSRYDADPSTGAVNH